MLYNDTGHVLESALETLHKVPIIGPLKNVPEFQARKARIGTVQKRRHHGVTLQKGVTPAKIVKNADGSLTVTDSKGGTSDYETVIVAVGRHADTSQLGLEHVPGAADSVSEKTGKFKCEQEQLPTARHVYAIGDVVHGAPELTPVAIEAGLRLARRLFGGSTERMDYENVATAVFTPLEYGSIGLSEENAKDAIGAANVESYVSQFSPLEHALSESRAERGDTSFAKLLVDKRDDRVIGLHYLGPNAGEITQGFSVAMRVGATYADFKATVGFPTGDDRIPLVFESGCRTVSGEDDREPKRFAKVRGALQNTLDRSKLDQRRPRYESETNANRSCLVGGRHPPHRRRGVHHHFGHQVQWRVRRQGRLLRLR